jgi:hypothetical protein
MQLHKNIKEQILKWMRFICISWYNGFEI